MEGQCEAAEHQAGNQGQPLAFFQFALADEQRAVDDQGADNQHGRGTVDATHGQGVPGDVDGTGFELVDDEKQEQRDEIDELFHSGSQKQDVPA
ncbi:hypothetical protein D9M71_237400 [compost metagenome]